MKSSIKPRKKKDVKRAVFVNVRFTADEYARIVKRWKIRGRGQRSKLVRDLLLSGSLK